MAPHYFTTRLMKCPKCGKKGWHKKSIKKMKRKQNANKPSVNLQLKKIGGCKNGMRLQLYQKKEISPKKKIKKTNKIIKIKGK